MVAAILAAQPLQPASEPFDLAVALPAADWGRRGLSGIGYDAWAAKVLRCDPALDGTHGFFVAVFERSKLLSGASSPCVPMPVVSYRLQMPRMHTHERLGPLIDLLARVASARTKLPALSSSCLACLPVCRLAQPMRSLAASELDSSKRKRPIEVRKSISNSTIHFV